MAGRYQQFKDAADLDEAARRSVQYGIDPVAVDLLPIGDLGDAAERLAGLSESVSRAMLDQLADASIGVVLADHRGNIAFRGSGSRDVRAAMDRYGLAVGYSLAEERVGTNGVGTALVSNRPAVVFGDDHHLEIFKQFACVQSPIIHPITHRITGAIGLVCPNSEATPLLLPTSMQLAQAIEDRLLRDASPNDRVLLDAFIRHRRSRGAALVAVNERTWIATPSARQLLAQHDHETVWRHVERSLRLRQSVKIGGSSGRVIKLDIREDLSPTAGIFSVSEVPMAPVDVSAQQGLAPVSSRLGDMVGQSAAWLRVVSSAEAAARARQPLMVVGEFGSGRCTLARAIGRRSGQHTMVFDAATVALEGAERWLSVIADSLGEARVLIVRDVDQLDDPVIRTLASFVRSEHRARLIFTMSSIDPFGDSLTQLRSVIPSSIVVPPLRSRPEDIEPIARQYLAAHGLTSVSHQFFGALRRRTWSGNVSGLRATLDCAMDSARNRRLEVGHLPPDVGGAKTGVHGTIQHAEESAIRRALEQANGNRTEAAALLGISRATLYRRLRSYGID